MKMYLIPDGRFVLTGTHQWYPEFLSRLIERLIFADPGNFRTNLIEFCFCRCWIPAQIQVRDQESTPSFKVIKILQRFAEK